MALGWPGPDFRIIHWPAALATSFHLSSGIEFIGTAGTSVSIFLPSPASRYRPDRSLLPGERKGQGAPGRQV